MTKKKNAAKPVETVLVIKKEPLPRKVRLMHDGVKAIRCISCLRIALIASAAECGDGWICGDCLSDMEKTQKYGGLHR